MKRVSWALIFDTPGYDKQDLIVIDAKFLWKMNFFITVVLMLCVDLKVVFKSSVTCNFS